MSTPRPDPVWRTTTALGAGIATGVVLLGTGLVLRRPDVALLGLPALLSAVWGWTHRPEGVVTVDVDRDPAAPAGTLAARVRVRTPPGTETVALRLVGPANLVSEHVLAVTGTPVRDLPVRTRSARTGVVDSYRVDHAAYGPEGVEEQVPTTTVGPRLLVLPRPVPLGRVPLASRLRGLAGPHTSRSPGDGTELRDVDGYRPGDTTRRVDWRATARRSPDLATELERIELAQVAGEGRATGFPQLALANGVAHVVWTEVAGGTPNLKGLSVLR